MKLTSYITWRLKRIFTELLDFSECIIKVRVRSHRALFVIFLTSAVICKQRLLNGIFKISNVIAFSKKTLESSSNLLQGPSKGAIFK